MSMVWVVIFVQPGSRKPVLRNEAELPDGEPLHLWNKRGSQPLLEIMKVKLVPEQDAWGFGGVEAKRAGGRGGLAATPPPTQLKGLQRGG